MVGAEAHGRGHDRHQGELISVCCHGREVHGATGPPGGDAGAGPVEGPPVVWISASGDGRSGGGVVLRAVAALTCPP